jgi:hypothetical protein
MPKKALDNNKSGDKIKIFVSTRETQGQRKSDFCFVPENEPVRLGFICDRDKHNPDGVCGCARSLIGLYCSRATTTFKVVLVSMTRRQYVNEYVEKNSYYNAENPELIKELEKEAWEMLDLSSIYKENSVLEYRAGNFAVRIGK